MGYTHSILHQVPLDAQKFSAFAADVKRMIEAKPTIPLRGGQGRPKPTATDEMVEFNGGCETFLLTRTLRPDLGQRLRDDNLFSFTKTLHMPYDVLVVAASFAFIYHFPDARFMSDGHREDLRPGYDLFVSACKPHLSGRDLFSEMEASPEK